MASQFRHGRQMKRPSDESTMASKFRHARQMKRPSDESTMASKFRHGRQMKRPSHESTMASKFRHGRQMKRPLDEPSDDDDEQLLLQQRLAAYGERFLKSFDDATDNSTAKRSKLDREAETDAALVGGQDKFDDWLQSIANKTTTTSNGESATLPVSTTSKSPSKPSIKVKVVDATQYGAPPPSSRQSNSAKEMNIFMSAEASKIHSNAQPNIASGKRRGKQIETFREQLAREVEELGATLLTGKEKKEYEARKMMRLGGKAPKNLKTPIKILQGMRTKEAERAQKKREEAIQSGMHVKKKKPRSTDTAKKSASKGLDLMKHAGKFRGGMLQIKPSLMKSKPKR